LGKIEIPIFFGEGSNFRTKDIAFNVVDITYPYNAIFGRGVPSLGGVISVLGDQKMARIMEVGTTLDRRNVHVVTEPSSKPLEVEDLLQTWRVPKAKPEGQTKKVLLCQDRPERAVIVGAEMTQEA
jgi:hypothetical protein